MQWAYAIATGISGVLGQNALKLVVVVNESDQEHFGIMQNFQNALLSVTGVELALFVILLVMQSAIMGRFQKEFVIVKQDGRGNVATTVCILC